MTSWVTSDSIFSVIAWPISNAGSSQQEREKIGDLVDEEDAEIAIVKDINKIRESRTGVELTSTLKELEPILLETSNSKRSDLSINEELTSLHDSERNLRDQLANIGFDDMEQALQSQKEQHQNHVVVVVEEIDKIKTSHVPPDPCDGALPNEESDLGEVPPESRSAKEKEEDLAGEDMQSLGFADGSTTNIFEAFEEDFSFFETSEWDLETELQSRQHLFSNNESDRVSRWFDSDWMDPEAEIKPPALETKLAKVQHGVEVRWFNGSKLNSATENLQAEYIIEQSPQQRSSLDQANTAAAATATASEPSGIYLMNSFYLNGSGGDLELASSRPISESSMTDETEPIMPSARNLNTKSRKILAQNAIDSIGIAKCTRCTCLPSIRRFQFRLTMRRLKRREHFEFEN